MSNVRIGNLKNIFKFFVEFCNEMGVGIVYIIKLVNNYCKTI